MTAEAGAVPVASGDTTPSVAAAAGLPTLNAAQRREYDEHGYTLVPGVFPAQELAAVDAEIERLQGRVAEETGRDDGWILRLGLRRS